MAAGLGFKDFTTGEVLTSSDVDGYLMQGVWVFASAAARSSAVTSPQEGNMSFLKDTNSVEYYTGSAWAAVGGGGGGGKVLQVLQAEYSTSTTIATTTYTDTGISLSITPSSATSKILVMSHNSGKIASASNMGVSSRIMRGATSVFQQDPTDYTAWFLSASNNELHFIDSMVYLDSPATTSATTYKTQSASRGSQTAVWQTGSKKSTITLMEIGA